GRAGGRGYLALSGRPIFDASGRFLGYRGTATEITERARRDYETADALAQLRDFAEATADWFWERDAELRFTYLSPSVERWTGYAAEHYIGKVSLDMGEELVVGAQREVRDAALVAREPFGDLLISRRAPDGSLRHSRVSGRPIFDADGAFAGFRGTGRDVTGEVESARATAAAHGRLAAAIDKLDEAF